MNTPDQPGFATHIPVALIQRGDTVYVEVNGVSYPATITHTEDIDDLYSDGDPQGKGRTLVRMDLMQVFPDDETLPRVFPAPAVPGTVRWNPDPRSGSEAVLVYRTPDMTDEQGHQIQDFVQTVMECDD